MHGAYASLCIEQWPARTAILVSNTLGTALGDCVSDDADFGFAYSALLFGGLGRRLL